MSLEFKALISWRRLNGRIRQEAACSLRPLPCVCILTCTGAFDLGVLIIFSISSILFMIFQFSRTNLGKFQKWVMPPCDFNVYVSHFTRRLGSVAFYSVCSGSHLGLWTLCLFFPFFFFFTQSHLENVGWYLKLGRDHIFSRSLFSDHPSIRHFIVWRTDGSVGKSHWSHNRNAKRFTMTYRNWRTHKIQRREGIRGAKIHGNSSPQVPEDDETLWMCLAPQSNAFEKLIFTHLVKVRYRVWNNLG
jgi:hypothetical protein